MKLRKIRGSILIGRDDVENTIRRGIQICIFRGLDHASNKCVDALSN